MGFDVYKLLETDLHRLLFSKRLTVTEFLQELYILLRKYSGNSVQINERIKLVHASGSFHVFTNLDVDTIRKLGFIYRSVSIDWIVLESNYDLARLIRFVRDLDSYLEIDFIPLDIY